MPAAAAPKETPEHAGLAATVGTDVATTLYGDLPEDFWGDAGSLPLDDGATPRQGGPAGETERWDADADHTTGVLDDAVPLFVPVAEGAALPLPSGAAAAPSPPDEPEGERYVQLRALFPGRIIAVSRRGGATAVSAADDAAAYAVAEEVADPFADTAASAGAEESA